MTHGFSFEISNYIQSSNKPLVGEKLGTLINSPPVSWLTGERVTMFPVLDIDQNDIVDTNGAGDAFAGGMEWKLSSAQLDFCVHSQLTFDTNQLCNVVMSPGYMSMTFSLLFLLCMSLS